MEHQITGASVEGTWKAHWEKYNEYGANWPICCSEKNCIERATVGAHVQKEVGYDKNWYIIPLCDEHNGPGFHGASIEISDGTSFASANQSETCGG